MRHPLATLLACCFIQAQAQFAVPDLFRIDPYQANGHFIVDEVEFRSLGLDHVKVDIIRTDQIAGSPEQTVLTTLHLDDAQFWGHVDRALLEQVPHDSRVHYRARGYKPNGTVVVDVEPGRFNGEPSYPACEQVCVGDNYAWLLAARSNYWETVSTIDILDAPYYFYVPAGEMQDFMDANDPPTWLGLSEWSHYVNPTAGSNAECFPLPIKPEGASGPNGIPLNPQYTGPVWAIQKKKGQWLGLNWYTDVYAGTGQVCVNYGENLVNYFNADPIVQDHIQNLPTNPGPLACPNGTLYPINYEGANGGLALGCQWEELLTYGSHENDDGTIDIIEIILYALNCEEGGEGSDWPPTMAPIGELSKVSGVAINCWSQGGGRVMDVSIPAPPQGGGPIDPKLIPVAKTELTPGLYEILIVMQDGTMRRRFEEVTTTQIVGASFDSFVQTTIYPVPVREPVCAIDFDLYAPMVINMTITNNMGETYHTETIDFKLAGKNKHVIKMNEMWPGGIYHAIFQYPDGSTGTRSFTVQSN